MRMSRTVIALALVAVAGGCVRKGSVPPPNGGHDVITAEELELVHDGSLYDAVRRLRPNFLKSRTITAYGRAESVPLMLYVDGEKMDSVDDLRRFTTAEVFEVRFYEPQLANARFGRYNNAGGAIAVMLKSGT